VLRLMNQWLAAHLNKMRGCRAAPAQVQRRCFESVLDSGAGGLMLVRKSNSITRAAYIAKVFCQLLLSSPGLLHSRRPADFVHNMVGKSETDSALQEKLSSGMMVEPLKHFTTHSLPFEWISLTAGVCYCSSSYPLTYYIASY